MNQAIATLTLTRKASSTIAPNRFVTPLCAQAGADANAIGVARSTAAVGEPVAVDVHGTAVVEAGAAFADGATLKCNASGQAITWATSGARVAIALEAATAAGQLVEVLLLDNAA